MYIYIYMVHPRKEATHAPHLPHPVMRKGWSCGNLSFFRSQVEKIQLPDSISGGCRGEARQFVQDNRLRAPRAGNLLSLSPSLSSRWRIGVFTGSRRFSLYRQVC